MKRRIATLFAGCTLALVGIAKGGPLDDEVVTQGKEDALWHRKAAEEGSGTARRFVDSAEAAAQRRKTLHAVTANVTNIAKTPPDPRGDAHEHLAQLRHGETFEDVLRALGADKGAIASILQAFGLKHGESPVAEGQKILLQFADTREDGKPAPIIRISAYSDDKLEASIAIDDAGDYVPVTLRRSAAVAKGVRTDADASAQTLPQPAFGGLTPSSYSIIGADALPQTKESVRSVSEIPLQKQGGTYLVSATINDVLSLDFIVDSGASDVSIPSDVFLTLIRTGTIRKEDILGKETYRLADGTKSYLKTFRIQRLKVGDLEIENVIASVSNLKGDLLLGQSFLTRFKSWSIDNKRGVLLLN